MVNGHTSTRCPTLRKKIGIIKEEKLIFRTVPGNRKNRIKSGKKARLEI